MYQTWSTVGLLPSHQQRWLALAFSGLLGLSVMSWPAATPWLWPAFLLLLPCFYGIAQWGQAAPPRFLSVNAAGEIRWHADQWSSGVLIPGAVICRFGVWLCWRDVEGKRQQCWLFRDQLADSDFRLLGRHCQQLHWQQAR